MNEITANVSTSLHTLNNVTKGPPTVTGRPVLMDLICFLHQVIFAAVFFTGSGQVAVELLAAVSRVHMLSIRPDRQHQYLCIPNSKLFSRFDIF